MRGTDVALSNATLVEVIEPAHSGAIMANLRGKSAATIRINARRFPFVVQIAVPDGGFGRTLDAVNAWHLYSKVRQRRHTKEKDFYRWHFEDAKTAEIFRQRFGGEIVVTTRPGPASLEQPCISQN